MYFIRNLELAYNAALPLLYQSINIADLDDPVNFVKTLALRLGWVIGEMEGCLFVLSKRPCELRLGHRIPAPSLLMYKIRDSEFHLSFQDSQQQGWLDIVPTTMGSVFKCNNRLIDSPEFNRRVADLVHSINDPGDFPSEQHAMFMHSSDSDSE